MTTGLRRIMRKSDGLRVLRSRVTAQLILPDKKPWLDHRARLRPRRNRCVPECPTGAGGPPDHALRHCEGFLRFVFNPQDVLLDTRRQPCISADVFRREPKLPIGNRWWLRCADDHPAGALLAVALRPRKVPPSRQLQLAQDRFQPVAVVKRLNLQVMELSDKGCGSIGNRSSREAK